MTDEQPDSTLPDTRFREAIAASVVVGVSYAFLAHGLEPGFGLAIVMLFLVVALARVRREDLSPAAMWCIGGAGVLACLIAVRSLPAMSALNVIGFVALISLAVGLARNPDYRRWPVSFLFSTALRTPGVALAPPKYLGESLGGSGRVWGGLRRHGGSVVVGLALTLVVIVVFGGLLVSADAVFESFANDLLESFENLDRIVELVVAGLVAAWLFLGALARLRDPVPLREVATKPVRMGSLAVEIPLAALVTLFVGFVAVQFAFFFGGADTLERTGLTPAEYARGGFFELVTVAALVIGVVLLVQWVKGHMVDGMGRRILVLNGTLIGLTLVVAAAAFGRMLLYVDRFGLTELRLYTTTFLVWVVLLLVLLGVTLLRKSRDFLVAGAVVTAFVLTVGLNLLHPARFVANVNIDRALSGTELDVEYLDSLGSGAAPVLEDRLDEVPLESIAPLEALDEPESADQNPETDWRTRTLDDVIAGW